LLSDVDAGIWVRQINRDKTLASLTTPELEVTDRTDLTGFHLTRKVLGRWRNSFTNIGGSQGNEKRIPFDLSLVVADLLQI
jgi:hypothetical protein